MRRRTVYWLCQLAGWATWGVIGLLYAVSTPIPYRLRPPDLLPYAATMLVSIAWTHGFRAVIRRGAWLALPPSRLLRRAIPASIVLGMVIPYSTVPVYYFLYPDRFAPIGWWMLPAFMNSTLSVLLWTSTYIAVHYFERWRQAEVDKLQLAVVATEAQLNGLQAQLNPHFLFNCLNSVRGLIAEDREKAQAAVTELASLMRYSLQRRTTVPLSAELEMVRTYLALEAVRLEERLATELAIADDTRDVPVPTMMVQALVENGVKHGIERLPAGGTLSVAAWRDAGELRVRVTNSGAIAPREGSTRVGLANAQERLRLLYGGRASLALREDAGAVIAELALPLEAA